MFSIRRSIFLDKGVDSIYVSIFDRLEKSSFQNVDEIFLLRARLNYISYLRTSPYYAHALNIVRISKLIAQNLRFIYFKILKNIIIMVQKTMPYLE